MASSGAALGEAGSARRGRGAWRGGDRSEVVVALEGVAAALGGGGGAQRGRDAWRSWRCLEGPATLGEVAVLGGADGDAWRVRWCLEGPAASAEDDDE